MARNIWVINLIPALAHGAVQHVGPISLSIFSRFQAMMGEQHGKTAYGNQTNWQQSGVKTMTDRIHNFYDHGYDPANTDIHKLAEKHIQPFTEAERKVISDAMYGIGIKRIDPLKQFFSLPYLGHDPYNSADDEAFMQNLRADAYCQCKPKPRGC